MQSYQASSVPWSRWTANTASGNTSSAPRITASSMRLSVYDRAPRAIWMMNGAETLSSTSASALSSLPRLRRNSPPWPAQVVDVVRADRVLAVGVGERLLGGHDHGVLPPQVPRAVCGVARHYRTGEIQRCCVDQRPSRLRSGTPMIRTSRVRRHVRTHPHAQRRTERSRAEPAASTRVVPRPRRIRWGPLVGRRGVDRARLAARAGARGRGQSLPRTGDGRGGRRGAAAPALA